METEITFTCDQIAAIVACPNEWTFLVIIEEIMTILRIVLCEYIQVPELANIVFGYAEMDMLGLLWRIAAINSDSIPVMIRNTQYYAYVEIFRNRLRIQFRGERKCIMLNDADLPTDINAIAMYEALVLDDVSASYWGAYYIGDLVRKKQSLFDSVNYDDVINIGKVCMECMIQTAKIMMWRLDNR